MTSALERRVARPRNRSDHTASYRGAKQPFFHPGVEALTTNEGGNV
jgi:hypothetical protein